MFWPRWQRDCCLVHQLVCPVRVFSHAEDIVSPHCSCLEPGCVETRIFLKVILLLLGFPEVPFT